MDKRPLDQSAGDGQPAKRPKLNLDALAKAKRALELQKQLKEKLKGMPQVKSGAAAAAPPAAAPGGAPLLLSNLGLPSAVQQSVAAAAATAAAATTATAKVPLQFVTPPEEAPTTAEFFDAEMGRAPITRHDRRKRGALEFVSEGTFQKQAEQMRLRAKYGPNVARRIARQVGPTEGPNQIAMDPNKMPLGKRAPAPKTVEEVEQAAEVPAVEWWDERVLATGSYDKDVGEEAVALKEKRITHLVEHPVPIEPVAEAPPPAPQPLKLTKKELKKLRTQRRLEREKEKQELIRQGLLEPPKPKVRLANLPQVLGEQAAADPTAVEQEVRRQMAERQTAHDDRNLARKLTSSEKRQKKLRKLFDDDDLTTWCCVYKLNHLQDRKQRFKVEVNANQNRMSGAILMTPEFSLVVVEGCSKAIKRYNKLMLRRMQWDLEDVLAELPDGQEPPPPNSCVLVWQGQVQHKAFQVFLSKECSSVSEAKMILQKAGVAHYWDVAANLNPDDVPIQPSL